jgi:hypothetical protein
LASTSIIRIRAWILVIVGLAVAIFGLISMGVYSPSLTSDDYLEICLLGGLIMMIGFVMVVSGWLTLREYKYEK